MPSLTASGPHPPDAAASAATLSFVAANRGRLVVHAGAVAAGSRTCLVVGASGAGKTTLTSALVHHGLAYLTDESVSLDPRSMLVVGHPKPLTVKPSSHEQLAHLREHAMQVDPESGNWHVTVPGAALDHGGLDPAAATTESVGPPSLVVLPDRHAEWAPDRVEVVAVPPARAAFVVGEQTSALWSVQPRPLAALVRLVLSVATWQVGYSDAFAAAPVVRDLLLRAPSGSRDLVDVEEAPAPAPPAVLGPARAVGVDWTELDGEAVLFDGGSLHHLDGPAAAAWRRLDGRTATPDLVRALAEQFGAPEAVVRTDVADLLRVLRGRGLVTTPGP